MTTTERAIAATYYRLVYINKVKTLADVPEQYRAILEEYVRELDGETPQR